MTQLMVKVKNKRQCRLDQALKEAAKGKTKSFNSVKELMEDLEN